MKVRSILALLLSMCCGTALSASEEEEFFEARVRPLLVKHCYECHRRKAEGGLRLDSLSDIKKGGSSGPAIVVGNAEKSLIWQVVSGKHDEISMPPDKPLNPAAIKTIEKWITAGAHWPQAIASVRATPDQHGISDEERSFWSFQPIRNPVVPLINDVWGYHPVDAFVAAGRDQRGLSPNDVASPRTLIRRLTLDLTGLPPTSQEVDEFLIAYKKDAIRSYDKLVLRLLASKHYGERWGQHWLDLVRYADTAGDAADFPVPEAYKYRNYVIDAFNNDKPYDQFVREQIAGDLLPAKDDDQRWEQTVATGYLAISRRIGVSPQNLRHITIEDTLNNLGKTFLGLSIGCARCHDHKFDPIPTADYYALYGIFESTIYPHAGAEHQPYRSDFVYRVGKQKADELLASHREKLEPWRNKERVAFERYREFQKKPINIPGYNRDVAWKDVLDLREEIRKVAETFPNLEIAYAASEGDVGDAAVQEQGDPKNRGAVVRRGFLQVLGGQSIDEDVDQSGRLQLAQWITDQNNPLTARVIVNRVWHHHFGRGLVASTSDFGVRGSKPTHPELLDYLANYLIQNDWSLKRLHRLIVTSRTYRLSSASVGPRLRWQGADTDEAPQRSFATQSRGNDTQAEPRDGVAGPRGVDPENHFLWRANRRRLDAEQLRDSVLAISGTLDRSPGGAHPVPHRLTYYFRQHEPYVADFPTNRRTIYQFRQRIRKDRYLDMFDGPDGNLHIGTRRPTTTSLQSLYFMNSKFVDTQSAQIAKRMIDAADSDAKRIEWAYQNIFGRPPNADEVRMTRSHVDKIDDVEVVAWSSMIRAMLSSNEFVFVD